MYLWIMRSDATTVCGAIGPSPASEDVLPAALRGRSPSYIRRSLPFTWPLIAAWFRPDIGGLDRIPSRGAVLLVGSHSGGNVAPDTLAFALAFYRHFRAERMFFQLAHHLVMVAPPLYFLRKYGTIEASSENALAALERGCRARVSGRGQRTLDDLAAQRRWPVIG
jgi:1-acyl-sn-glycerol-3-phosphate acyltransferase